jgi:diguanylate cyclase (GGDEF)-like protein/PAS domain S-box-containing protein
MADPGNTVADILIIEDEALVARDIQSRLKQLGHRVLGLAHSPRQALELAAETQPGLLLCDIHLKDDIDGIEVARQITKSRNIPVIFLTAYSDRDTVARAKSIAPYGYVLKPIETPDLQIAIEMALHKFSVEQELNRTRQLLATALQCIGDALVFVDGSQRITAMNREAMQLFGLAPDRVEGLDCAQLLQERCGDNQSASLSWGNLLVTSAVTRLPPFQVSRPGGSQLLVDGVVGPIQQAGNQDGVVLMLRQLAELQDPVENLPVPGALPDGFNGIYDYPLDHERAFVLLLISPDSPDAIMGELPDEQRDALIREIAEQLNLAMRRTDLASYYGGSVFSASLPYTTLEEANSIASAILQRLAQHRFLDGVLRLTASIGISHHRADGSDGDGESPLELFRRAHRALELARQSGGNRAAIWRPSTDIGVIGNLDSQSGLLAADAGQDYRNMALLWNTMNSAASSQDARAQAKDLAGRLQRCFHLGQVALFTLRGEHTELIAGAPSVPAATAGALLAKFTDWIGGSSPDKQPEQLDGSYCVPVTFGPKLGGGPGLLYMESRDIQLRRQDLLLMQSLVTYLGGPASTGSSGETDHPDTPSGRSELLFQSDVMAEVVELIRLVAPTDETVLLTGESGTGKEVIASEIHRLSSRATAPFVIVDCGAVVSTLIERELFGHVRGAFTGATHSAPGKLKEAEGGTLLLDEIGELPLDVQVKLLRVVQEKQFTAVGSTRVETVNTRIIAATNVDLEAEIRGGRFREDLYYRLNVFNVHSPPLRHRGGDIMFLARHFLSRCSAQYGRNIQGFTTAAEEAMQAYPWPGNVRELRNKLMRAVILCQDAEIDVAELDLQRIPERSLEPPTGIGRPREPAPLDPQPSNLAEIETEIRDAMEEQLDFCLQSNVLLPLSQWLEQDLILAALELSGQVNLQAASTLGIPESTLRRKLSRYQADNTLRPPEFQGRWQAVIALLPGWIAVARREGFQPLAHLQNLLLSLIDKRARTQSEAAALVGVSPPTYRRQLNQLVDW